MPIDDLTALGQKMRGARKNKELTQQELSDLSHVSVKQIANIEKGKINPSYSILRALAKVLHISLDTVPNPSINCSAVTRKSCDELAIIYFLRICYIVDDVTDCPTFCAPLANMKRHDSCSCHNRRPSSHKYFCFR